MMVSAVDAGVRIGAGGVGGDGRRRGRNPGGDDLLLRAGDGVITGRTGITDHGGRIDGHVDFSYETTRPEDLANKFIIYNRILSTLDIISSIGYYICTLSEVFMTAPLITLVGASGAGKTTLIRHLLENIPQTKFLKLYTTRPPRTPEEISSSYEYQFVDIEQYRALQQKATAWEELQAGGYHYGVDVSAIELLREQGTIFLSTMILQRISLDKRIKLYRPPVIYVTLDVSQEVLIARGIPMERILRHNEPLDSFKDISSLVLTQTGNREEDLANALNQFQKLIASFTTNPS